MGHGHEDHSNLIPKDPKIYDPDKCPDLVKLKERLAKHGLKDPWMRNEVYKYQFAEIGVLRSFLAIAGGVKCIGLGCAIGGLGALYWNWSVANEGHHHAEGDGGHH